MKTSTFNKVSKEEEKVNDVASTGITKGYSSKARFQLSLSLLEGTLKTFLYVSEKPEFTYNVNVEKFIEYHNLIKYIDKNQGMIHKVKDLVTFNNFSKTVTKDIVHVKKTLNSIPNIVPNTSILNSGTMLTRTKVVELQNLLKYMEHECEKSFHVNIQNIRDVSWTKGNESKALFSIESNTYKFKAYDILTRELTSLGNDIASLLLPKKK